MKSFARVGLSNDIDICACLWLFGSLCDLAVHLACCHLDKERSEFRSRHQDAPKPLA